MRWNNFGHVFSLTFLAAVLFFSSISRAQDSINHLIEEERVVLITDFDRTLTGPAWNSFWFLKKVPTVNNHFQITTPTPQGEVRFDELPNEVAVSESEFINLYKNQLAVQERQGQFIIGNRNAIVLPAYPFPGRETPILFLPGYYRVADDSFVRFRSNSRENFLLSDNEVARQRENTRSSRFGISFSLFQRLTQRTGNVGNIHVVTARGQTQQEFNELFDTWQEEGWLRNTEGKPYISRQGPASEQISIYNLGSGESVLYGDRLTEKKVRVVRDFIITHYRLQGLQRGKKFLIVVAEDNPEIVKEYHKIFTEFSAISNYNSTMNFLLVHAGTDEEVKASPLPDRFVTYKQGFASAAPEEMVSELFPQKTPRRIYLEERLQLQKRQCLQLFVKGV